MVETQSNLGRIVMTALAIMLGIAFLGILNSTIQGQTVEEEQTLYVTESWSLWDEYNETLNGFNETKPIDLAYQNVYDFKLSRPLINETNYAINGTDYLVDLEAGQFFLKNDSEFWLDISEDEVGYALYSVDETTQVSAYSGFIRILLNMIIGLFAVAILGGVVYSLVKTFGVQNE